MTCKRFMREVRDLWEQNYAKDLVFYTGSVLYLHRTWTVLQRLGSPYTQASYVLYTNSELDLDRGFACCHNTTALMRHQPGLRQMSTEDLDWHDNLPSPGDYRLGPNNEWHVHVTEDADSMRNSRTRWPPADDPDCKRIAFQPYDLEPSG